MKRKIVFEDGERRKKGENPFAQLPAYEYVKAKTLYKEWRAQNPQAQIIDEYYDESANPERIVVFYKP